MTREDEDSNTGVIVGVVVAIVVVLAIIGTLVATALLCWHHHRHVDRVDLVEPKEHGTSGNHRPTTLSYSERPLLGSSINTYTSTATPLNGAHELHNAQDPASQVSNHLNNVEEVQDGDIDFDVNNADSGSVTV